MSTNLQTREFAGTTVPTAGTFVIEAGHTTIGFLARHLMVTKVRGRFTEFDGTITVAENPLDSSATFTAKVASIDTSNAQRDEHLRGQDFFSAEHPDLTYTTTSLEHVRGDKFKATGDLSVNGVTKSIELDVVIDGVVIDPWGNERLALTGHGEIDREEFGITWNAALESGGVLVSKKIVLELDVQAVRQA